MKNNTVIDLDNPEKIDALTELLRSGAKKLIAEAIQAGKGMCHQDQDVDDYLQDGNIRRRFLAQSERLQAPGEGD